MTNGNTRQLKRETMVLSMDDILIPDQFRKSPPRSEKLARIETY